ncbi:hypothetical protein QQF64_034721 [Cirrhinus molitorella]|uniref:LRRNT domain-containing protein n=1 Tax=Cirrhinus molitorella TaxID=172907 RepID=A0ABR3L269_9TELE
MWQQQQLRSCCLMGTRRVGSGDSRTGSSGLWLKWPLCRQQDATEGGCLSNYHPAAVHRGARQQCKLMPERNKQLPIHVPFACGKELRSIMEEISTQEDEKSFPALLGYKATEQNDNVKCMQTDKDRKYMESLASPVPSLPEVLVYTVHAKIFHNLATHFPLGAIHKMESLRGFMMRWVKYWGTVAVLCGLLCCAVNGCPHKCSCSGSHVDCQGQGFKTVPKGIPRNAERLDLDRNNITRITKVDFSGLKNLRVLHLENNQISVIERGAFQDLKQLERIRLNRNRLQVLPELLFQSTPKLGRLAGMFSGVIPLARPDVILSDGAGIRAKPNVTRPLPMLLMERRRCAGGNIFLG